MFIVIFLPYLCFSFVCAYEIHYFCVVTVAGQLQ